MQDTISLKTFWQCPFFTNSTLLNPNLPIARSNFSFEPGIQDGAQYGGKCWGNFAILRDGMLGEVSILGFLGSLRTTKYISNSSGNRKCKMAAKIRKKSGLYVKQCCIRGFSESLRRMVTFSRSSDYRKFDFQYGGSEIEKKFLQILVFFPKFSHHLLPFLV